jgi:roadblock/LC7 domain-containing protein
MGFFDSDVEYGDAYNLPTDYKSGLKDILGEAKKLYESRKETGYQDYPGERIAGFTPEELAAMQGISGLVGAGAKYFDPATNLAKGLGERFTSDTAQSYMNPYQQSVVDVEKRKAREDFDQTMQGIGTKAVGAGSFGGSRQAILEGEATSDLGQRLGDIQAIGTKQAFDDARKAFEAQKGRERLSGSALASLGQQAPNQALKELTALAGVGEAGRGMEQNKYDMAYQNFLDRQNFAGNALGDYAGMVYGFPTQGFQKQTQGFAQPSGFQNLMGVIGAGKSLFPSFGFKEGGHIAFRSNGGLSGLMTPQTIDAIVENDFEDEPAKTSTPSKKDMIQKYLEQMLKGSSNVTDEYAKALKAQAEIANIKKKRLEDRGFMDRLGEFAQGVAEGYDPTRPQSMAGSLAAGAKAVKSDDQILQERADIEEQLAKGQIGLAEAKVKLANLNLKTFTALDKLKTDPFKFEAPSITEIEKLIEGNLGSSLSKAGPIKNDRKLLEFMNKLKIMQE